MARQKQWFDKRLLKGILFALFFPVILPYVLIVFILYLLHRTTLYFLIWLLWLPKGKDVLLVYSDSPIWHDYMLMATEGMPVQDFASGSIGFYAPAPPPPPSPSPTGSPSNQGNGNGHGKPGH